MARSTMAHKREDTGMSDVADIRIDVCSDDAPQDDDSRAVSR